MEAREKPRTKRKEQAEARREQLLDVALQLFSEKGVRGSTIRDIAQAAGVTEGLIYRYFPSKVALVQAVLESFGPKHPFVELVESLEGLPLRQAYTQLAHGHLEMLNRDRRFITWSFHESQSDPEVALVIGTFIAEAMRAGTKFVQRRIDAGELRPHDPLVSLRLLQGSLFTYFLMEKNLSPPIPYVDRDTFVNEAVEIVLRGIAAHRPEETE